MSFMAKLINKSSDVVLNLECYTEENFTGKYFLGKKVYSIGYKGTVSNAKNIIDNLNIECILSSNGYAHSNYDYAFPLNYSGDNYQFYLRKSISSNKWQLYSGSYYSSNNQCEIKLEYTKKQD